VDLKDNVSEFLALGTHAVTSVSRSDTGTGNVIARRLRETGHEVFAVNPNLDQFDDRSCYPELSSLPSVPGGGVIVNRPEVTLKICHECTLGAKLDQIFAPRSVNHSKHPYHSMSSQGFSSVNF